MRILRLVLELVADAIAAVIVWRLVGLALEAILDPSPVGIRNTGYPNEWGVRTTPLSRAELEAALERERYAFPTDNAPAGGVDSGSPAATVSDSRRTAGA